MASNPTKFCKIINQEQADSLRLPNKFALKCGEKLPKDEVYLKVPNGLAWPVEVAYSKSNGEVWLREGWKAFGDYYSIGYGYFLEFKYNGVAMFEVIIFDITGSEIEYKYEHICTNVGAHDPQFYKIIVDPECDRLRVPLTFTQRYGANLPDSVSIHVPGDTSMWDVKLVRDMDGEIYMEGGWKKFRECYDIDFGYSLVFQFNRKYALFDVSIYDGSATEKEFQFDLDDVHVERCDSDEDDSLVLKEEILRNRKGKEVVVVSDDSVNYHQEDNRTCVGIDGYGQETKRKRVVSDVSVDYLVEKSVQSVKLGGGIKAERRKTSDCPRGMRNSTGTVKQASLSFTKEIKLNSVHRLDIPMHFVQGTGIDKLTSVRLDDDEGKKWPVHVIRIARSDVFMCKGWYDYLIGNNVVVGSTIYFRWSSKNTIKTHVVKEGADRQALFKFVKRKASKYELFKPRRCT